MSPRLTLSIIRHGSSVKGSNPGNGVAPSPTPWCSSYRKGNRQVANLLCFYIVSFKTLLFSKHPNKHTHAYIHIYIYREKDTYIYIYILYPLKIRTSAYFYKRLIFFKTKVAHEWFTLTPALAKWQGVLQKKKKKKAKKQNKEITGKKISFLVVTVSCIRYCGYSSGVIDRVESLLVLLPGSHRPGVVEPVWIE